MMEKNTLKQRPRFTEISCLSLVVDLRDTIHV